MYKLKLKESKSIETSKEKRKKIMVNKTFINYKIKFILI